MSDGYRDVAHVIRYDEERLKYCEKEIYDSERWLKRLENRRTEYTGRRRMSLMTIAVVGGVFGFFLLTFLLCWGTISNGHYSFTGPYGNSPVMAAAGMGILFCVIFLGIGLAASCIWHAVNIHKSRYYHDRTRPGEHPISELIAWEKQYLEKMMKERTVAVANYEADKRKVYENTNSYKPEEEKVIDFSELIKARNMRELEDKSYFADTFADLSDKRKR